MLAGAGYFVFIRPARIKALYRRGVPVIGRVVRKSKAGRYGELVEILYEFPKADGGAAKRTMTVAANDRNAKGWTGEPVTVLHPPNRSRPSVIYEHGQYECDGAEWI
jgi:hypothetical protein